MEQACRYFGTLFYFCGEYPVMGGFVVKNKRYV